MRRVLVPHDLSPRAPAFGAVVHPLDGQTMGTTWSVRFAGSREHAVETVRAGIQGQLDTVVAQMSTWLAGSDLSRFNEAGADRWQALPQEFFHVLRHALQVAQASGGAYDPTAGPLVELWGFGPGRSFRDPGFEPPDADAIASARAFCGWQRVSLDPRESRARHAGGVNLDLSAIAKGYAVDLVAQHLEARGIESYLVEVGGELRGAGTKPDGQPWWVALELPPAEDDASHSSTPCPDTLVALHGLAIATSGDYRRFFRHEGRRLAHTIDPRTGRPVTHDLASVTVLHRECMAADALSTALTVLGPDEGFAFAKERELAACFLTRRGSGFEERLTPAFEAMLQ